MFLARLWTPGGLQAGLLRLRQLGDAVASESLGSNPISVVLWLLELWQVSLSEAQFLLENGVINLYVFSRPSARIISHVGAIGMLVIR